MQRRGWRDLHWKLAERDRMRLSSPGGCRAPAPCLAARRTGFRRRL